MCACRYECNKRVCRDRLYALLVAVQMAKDSMNLNPRTYPGLLHEALCRGPKAAERLVRQIHPNMAFCVYDDENLYKRGKTVVYRVEVDEEASIVGGSFTAVVNGTTIAHSTFGASCVLRIDVPEKTEKLKEKKTREKMAKNLANGITLFGICFKPFGTKSDQNRSRQSSKPAQLARPSPSCV